MFSLALIALVVSTVAQGVFSVPSGKRAVDPRVVVVLNDGVSMANVGVSDSPSIQKLDVINGFIAHESELDFERLRADPNVLSVERDQIIKGGGYGPMSDLVTRENTTWGLERLNSTGRLTNQDALALDFKYTSLRPAGEGVDVYVLDTGVRVTHEQFGGRARWGATFGGYPDSDGNGHGTHCAGIVGSSHFGVANRSNIIAVKVLDDENMGSFSDAILGLDWVYNEVLKTSRPSVVSISFSGSAFAAMDLAVAKIVESNIHVVVIAGNYYSDATNFSPSRVREAITVGAMDITDTRPFFSNSGSVVDIHAPGIHVISTWNTSDTATYADGGTSMAAPHVSGLVAYIISVKGNMSPAAMSDLIKAWGIKDALHNIPAGTPNLLAHISLE